MRVPEPFALGLEGLIEGGKRCDLVGIEGKPDGLVTTAVARLQKLDGNDCRFGSDRDQLEEPVGGSDLAVFELEALRLEDAVELLDQPAPLVPFDDAPSLFYTCHRVVGEKPPVQRLGAGLRIDLTHAMSGVTIVAVPPAAAAPLTTAVLRKSRRSNLVFSRPPPCLRDENPDVSFLWASMLRLAWSGKVRFWLVFAIGAHSA
jgi:hypothetical protein